MAWIVCLTMASCTNQEIIEQAIKPVHSNTLNVLTEKQESRSVLSYEGTFYWTENDYIGVYGTETENARFHFTSQADGVSTFTGNMNAFEEKVSWAYFPYSEKVDVTKKQLSFPIPVERTISNENHSPMIGRVEANNTVRFYHTGGILHLKIVGLPEHAAQLVITSEGENSPCLAGTAVIDDITGDGCTYRIDNGSKEVVYDVRNLEGGENFYSVYMPLQIGTYERIEVALKNEMGGIIKERSLSDLVVTRSKMTETPVLNFSEKVYGYELSKDWLVETEWDEAILFSNEWFIACDNDSEEVRRYFISNVIDWGTEDARALQVMLDTEGNLLNMTNGSFSAYFSNRRGNNVDITLMFENNMEKFTSLYIPCRKAQGRDVGSYFVSDVITVVDALNNIRNVIKPNPEIIGTDRIVRELATTSLGLQVISSAIDNQALSIVMNIAGGAFSGACTGAVAGMIVGSTVPGVGTAAGAVTGAISGALAGAIKETVKVILQVLDTWNNNRIYENFCGSAEICIGEPKQINNNTFNISYTLRNTKSVPDIYKGRGRCGLLVKEVSNYNLALRTIERIRYGGIGVERYGERDLSSDCNHSENISFERGHTYLIVAYVTAFDVTDTNILNNLNPICYYSDVREITFYETSLENVTIAPNNPLAYYDEYFHTTVRANVQCDALARRWNVEILQNGETFMIQNFSGNEPQEVVFNMSISKYHFDLLSRDEKLKPDDKWQIAVSMVDSEGNHISAQAEDLDLIYNISPSIKIISARKLETKKISSSSSRAEDDDDDKDTYQTTYEIKVQVEGSPRFRYFNVSSSKGYLSSGNIEPHKDGEYVYQGKIVYKENEEPEYIYVYGHSFYWSGDYKPFGATIRCIGSPIYSCIID